MYNRSDIHFLREKIQDLKNALFFPQNTALLRIATAIISVLRVDELGQMWFFVPKPRQALHEFDREFPVRLDFFRKGKKFFLHVSGKAFIVTDPEEINNLVFEDLRQQAGNHMVLIKVKMTKADYFESPDMSHQAGWWRDLCSHVNAWLFNTRPGYKPYNLADTPMPMLSYRPVA